MPTVKLSHESLQAFKGQIRGNVIAPDDPTYHDTRKVFNGAIDRKPALIVKCKDVADVIAAVNFGRENGLLAAIRGGGHNGAGLGVCDDGIVIDLSLMRGVRVDPATKTVRVEGGALLGDVDHATHAFGLAVPSGINATTGIAGLTLGGGLGNLTRSCGLTIDNLLEADVVLADGKFVTASEKQHPELFWALRGGGGNFGVVTSFLFKSHPVHTVYGGPMFWHLEDTKDMMKWYREFIKKAPDNLGGFFAFHIVPPGPPFPEHLHLKKVCGVVWCYSGPIEDAEKVFKPIREFRTPALDAVGPLPLPMMQQLFDALFIPGMSWYWKADFVDDLSDKAIDIHYKHAQQLPNFNSGMHLYPVNGAASRIKKDATPWSARGANWSMVIVGVDPNIPDQEKTNKWARDYWTELHPHNRPGAYVNFMMEEGDERVKATYGENYDRLVKAKRTYDPKNFFRVNQNVKP